MKVIFLDIDGVLSLDGWIIDSVCLDNLKLILEEADAEIVLSSTWRLYEDQFEHFKHELEAAKMKPLYGVTPESVNRLAEINLWLKEHSEVTHYAIIDDNKELKDVPNCFLTSSFYDGLTKEIALKVIDFLEEVVCENT